MQIVEERLLDFVRTRTSASRFLHRLKRKDGDTNNCESENREGENECDLADTALLEFAGGVREEKNRREQHSVGEILARQIAGPARLLYFGRGRCRCFSRFAGAGNFVKVRHEGMRIGLGIFEWLLREPCVVGFTDIRRKTL